MILMAALECFNTRGVAGTTIAEIRAKAGASVGSIYHHFGSKEAIAAALYLEGLREYQRGFVERVRRHRTAEAGIKAAVGYHLAWVRSHQAWARYLLHTREAAFLTDAEDDIRKLNRAFFADVDAWGTPHVEAGALARLPSPLFFAILLGPAQLYARHWLAGRTDLPPERARGVLGSAAWNALRGGRGRTRP